MSAAKKKKVDPVEPVEPETLPVTEEKRGRGRPSLASQGLSKKITLSGYVDQEVYDEFALLGKAKDSISEIVVEALLFALPEMKKRYAKVLA